MKDSFTIRFGINRRSKMFALNKKRDFQEWCEVWAWTTIILALAWFGFGAIAGLMGR
jgi:hypothetical protein